MRARKFFLLNSLKLDYTRDVKKAIHVILTCDLFNFLMNEKKNIKERSSLLCQGNNDNNFLLQWLVKLYENEDNNLARNTN